MKYVLSGFLAVSRSKRLVVLVWVLTLGFALAVALPVMAVLTANLGHSLYAGRMLDNFDPGWFAEFLLLTQGTPVAAISPLFYLLPAAFLLLGTFLTGGILSVYVSGTGYTTVEFWPACMRYFGRLLRLLLLFGAVCAVVLALNGAAQSIGQKIWGQGMEERPLVIYGWVRAGIVVPVLLWVTMVFDYARIRLVAGDARGVFRSWLDALRFAARYPLRTAGLYAGLCLIAGAGIAIYMLISNTLPRRTGFMLFLMLLVQQAFVFARSWMKLWFLASQTELYVALRPPTAPDTPEPVPVEPAALQPEPAPSEPELST